MTSRTILLPLIILVLIVSACGGGEGDADNKADSPARGDPFNPLVARTERHSVTAEEGEDLALELADGAQVVIPADQVPAVSTVSVQPIANGTRQYPPPNAAEMGQVYEIEASDSTAGSS